MPEIVDFKTAVNVGVPDRSTQETLKTLGESGGTNCINGFTTNYNPAPEVNVGTSSNTDVEMIPSINPFNSYMVLTPEILKIN